MFCSVLFCYILFYPVLFYSILAYSGLFCSQHPSPRRPRLPAVFARPDAPRYTTPDALTQYVPTPHPAPHLATPRGRMCIVSELLHIAGYASKLASWLGEGELANGVRAVVVYDDPPPSSAAYSAQRGGTPPPRPMLGGTPPAC